MEYLRVKVLPKSSQNQIISITQEDTEFGDQATVKIKLRAVPEKGKANQALIEFLSEALNLSKNQISIISGANARLKLLKIDSDNTLTKIAKLISN